VERFVDDLSRWYIRRSRRRLQKPINALEHQYASETLGFALTKLSILMAPFTPFFAEALYLSLKTKSSERGAFKESVHMENWPIAPKTALKRGRKLLEDMELVRNLASLALARREDANIKVRQPLSRLVLKTPIEGQLADILKEEVNVREISFDASLNEPLELNTALTEDLVREGIVREVIRLIQGMRQKIACKPSDKISLFLVASKRIESAVREQEKIVVSETSASRIEFRKGEKTDMQSESSIQGEKISLGIKKGS